MPKRLMTLQIIHITTQIIMAQIEILTSTSAIYATGISLFMCLGMGVLEYINNPVMMGVAGKLPW